MNSRKMVKFGEEGYLPGQEQAKEDVYFDGHVGQQCWVEVIDDTLKYEILRMCDITDADQTQTVLLSADIFSEGKSFLTLYYVGLACNAKSCNLGNFVEASSNYPLCWRIIERLAQAQAER